VRPDPAVQTSFVSAVPASKGGDTVRLSGDDASWAFDSFLDEATTQANVYARVAEPIVASVLDGYNGTIMAYGQTGSGKTHTMFGTVADPGVIPRSLAHLFGAAERDSAAETTISVSYVQIYNEMLTDLLCPDDDLQRANSLAQAVGRKPTSSLTIREDPAKGVIIENLKAVSVSGVEEAMSVIRDGDDNRVRASTNMNANSSRSHACVIVNVKLRNTSRKRVKRGKLILVDLAGSERVSKSLGDHVYSGVRFSETRAINVSLSALGNCVSALAKKKRHVPFRDAKLTRLLKDSLGGNSMTALVINIAKDPASSSETKSTLAFGSRAMAVTNTRVRINEEVDYEQLYGTLQASLDSRDDQIAELEIALRKTQIELAEARKAQAKSESEKEIVDMQLRTVSVSEEATEQIAALQKEHRAALQAAEERFGETVAQERAKAAAAQEEWYRIEFDLKTEREEHLRTCALLREKQVQLADLETAHDERVAELLEEVRASNEKADALAHSLNNAFEERKLLNARTAKLEARLTEGKVIEERGLKLMERLTSRVEVLERKRAGAGDSDDNTRFGGDEDDEYDRRSSGRASSRSFDCAPRHGSRRLLDRSESAAQARAGARKPRLPTAARQPPRGSKLTPAGLLPAAIKQPYQQPAAAAAAVAARRSAAASILRF